MTNGEYRSLPLSLQIRQSKASKEHSSLPADHRSPNQQTMASWLLPSWHQRPLPESWSTVTLVQPGALPLEDACVHGDAHSVPAVQVCICGPHGGVAPADGGNSGSPGPAPAGPRLAWIHCHPRRSLLAPG